MIQSNVNVLSNIRNKKEGKMDEFKVLAVNPEVIVSDQTIQLTQEILCLAEMSELVSPMSGEFFLRDTVAGTMVKGFVTPEPSEKRRISRSVCVPIQANIEDGTVVPGNTTCGTALKPGDRASLFALLSTKTGAQLIIWTNQGWIISPDVTVDFQTEPGSADEAEAILFAIKEKYGREGLRGYKGVVRLYNQGDLMIIQDAKKFLEDFCTAVDATHAHRGRLGFKPLSDSSFGGVFRHDTRVVGMVVLHKDGTISPYILPDYRRGGLGIGLVKLLWDRKKSVLALRKSNIERFYKGWGFVSTVSKHPEHLVQLDAPTLHPELILPACMTVLIAPNAGKVLAGVRSGETEFYPGHWGPPVQIRRPHRVKKVDLQDLESCITIPDNLKPTKIKELYVGINEFIFRFAIGIFEIPEKYEDDYLNREWFPHNSEYIRFAWLFLNDALTQRPTNPLTRYILTDVILGLRNRK